MCCSETLLLGEKPYTDPTAVDAPQLVEPKHNERPDSLQKNLPAEQKHIEKDPRRQFYLTPNTVLLDIFIVTTFR